MVGGTLAINGDRGMIGIKTMDICNINNTATGIWDIMEAMEVMEVMGAMDIQCIMDTINPILGNPVNAIGVQHNSIGKHTQCIMMAITNNGNNGTQAIHGCKLI
ncbi:hypothetical protein RST01_11310 [Rummeliibacillus stabekisii]|nr:hypothetical protein RST01_11310 [Rummeliibacillus stabekisii]